VNIVNLFRIHGLEKVGQAKQTVVNSATVPAGQSPRESLAEYLPPGGWSFRSPRWRLLGPGRRWGRWPPSGRGRDTAQTFATWAKSRRCGYARRWPPLALTSARMPARIASGRSSQAAVTLAQSGSAGTADGGEPGVPRVVGTTVGTARCSTLPKSLAPSGLTASWLRPPEPKVTGSSPVGDTQKALSDKSLRQGFFCLLSAAVPHFTGFHRVGCRERSSRTAKVRFGQGRTAPEQENDGQRPAGTAAGRFKVPGRQAAWRGRPTASNP
jgi:hypothetical protein